MSFNSPLSKILNAIFVDKNLIKECSLGELKANGFIINRQMSLMNPELGQYLNNTDTPSEIIPLVWWTHVARKQSVPAKAYPDRKKKIPYTNDDHRDIEKLILDKLNSD